MRVGDNPSKSNFLIKIDSTHRIIISVYIPNLEEPYFKQSQKIFRLCLESLISTVHQNTRISIIINGCCEEVQEMIYDYKNRFSIVDQVFYTKENLGKINAIYSIVKSNLEPLFTVTDADVMFLPNWQYEIERVFQEFPEAGMVSPVPSSKGYLYSTASTIFYGLFKGKIKFQDVKDPEGLINFQNSVGSNLYQDIHLKKYLVVSNGKAEAVVGCGHFVATFRNEVFESGPSQVCKYRVQGDSEVNYLDSPNDKAGYLRLATLGNYAYHLGNSMMPWMETKFEEIKSSQSKAQALEIPLGKPLKSWEYKIGRFLFKLLFYKYRRSFFSYLGMKVPY